MGFSLGEMLREISKRSKEKGIEAEMMDKNVQNEMAKRYLTHEEIQDNMKKAEQRKAQEESEREAQRKQHRYRENCLCNYCVTLRMNAKEANAYREAKKNREDSVERPLNSHEIAEMQARTLNHVEQIEKERDIYGQQLDKLASYLFVNYPDAVEDGGAVDVAIRLLNSFLNGSLQYNELQAEHLKVKEEKHKVYQDIKKVEKVYEETLEDLEQHKKALVELAVAFSAPFEKMKVENEVLQKENAELKAEIERISTFNPHIEIMSNIRDVAANFGKDVGKLSDNI